jgi:translation initiation factor IF-3
MDYGKFKYAEQKKAAEAKSKQKVIEIKEIKFRPALTMATTTSSCVTSSASEEGDKCQFCGFSREITHQELGLALLARIRMRWQI